MSLRPSEAQQVELCAYSAVLRAKNTPTSTPYANFGRAFAAFVEGDPARIKDSLVYLSEEEKVTLVELGDYYNREWPLPPSARHEWKFALTADGHPCNWDDDRRVTRGAVDHCWGEDGPVYVVRDDKTGERPITHPADNLQLAPYLVAVGNMATLGARAIGEVANPRLRQLYRYEYQPGEVERLWERFLRAEEKTRVVPVVAEPGGHCSECYERMRCDVRLLPAMGGHVDLMQFCFEDEMTDETAVRGIRLIQAMKDIAERADEQLRAWVLEHGPIVDGGKEWGPGTAQGRESADLKLLKADGLTRYIKRGQPYQTFRWRNRKAPF